MPSEKNADLARILEGHRIVRAVEQKFGSSRGVMLELDDGTRVNISEEGGPGADSEWYDVLVIRANGREVFRG